MGSLVFQKGMMSSLQLYGKAGAAIVEGVLSPTHVVTIMGSLALSISMWSKPPALSQFWKEGLLST